MVAKITVVCDSHAGRHARLGDSTIEKFVRYQNHPDQMGWRVFHRPVPRDGHPQASRAAIALTGENRVAEWQPTPEVDHMNTAERRARDAARYEMYSGTRATRGVRLRWEFVCPLCGDRLEVSNAALERLLDASAGAGIGRLSLATARRVLA